MVEVAADMAAIDHSRLANHVVEMQTKHPIDELVPFGPAERALARPVAVVNDDPGVRLQRSLLATDPVCA